MVAGKVMGWIGAVAVAATAAVAVQAQSANASAARAKPLRVKAQTTWNLVDLGTLGGPGSYATAVTNGGIVVGCSDAAGSGTHAFVYQAGAMRDLGTGTAGGEGNSCAYAANDRGMVAGRAASGELVVWKDGGVTGLGVKGTVGDVNGDGVVVGSYTDATLTRAFAWRQGVMTDLGNLGTDASTLSSANAINERGQVVGNSNNHAFLYENGAMRDLGTLGGASSIAKGVNDYGQVVGMAGNERGQPTPFLYTGSMQALDAPSYSAAIAINDRGQVIGSGEGIYGYVIDRGVVTRLDTLPAVKAKGWRHLEPTGINDRGWIVGTATTASGDLRAFLLLPGA